MSLFGLTFLLYFLKLSAGNGSCVEDGEKKFKQCSVKFTKKTRPHLVYTGYVHECHQIKLVSMSKL